MRSFLGSLLNRVDYDTPMDVTRRTPILRQVFRFSVRPHVTNISTNMCAQSTVFSHIVEGFYVFVHELDLGSMENFNDVFQ